MCRYFVALTKFSARGIIHRLCIHYFDLSPVTLTFTLAKGLHSVLSLVNIFNFTGCKSPKQSKADLNISQDRGIRQSAKLEVLSKTLLCQRRRKREAIQKSNTYVNLNMAEYWPYYAAQQWAPQWKLSLQIIHTEVNLHLLAWLEGWQTCQTRVSRSPDYT